MSAFSNPKNFAKLLIASGILLTSLSVFAKDGPGSVGGGDPILSSTGDVESALFKAIPILIQFIEVDLKSDETSTVLAIAEKIRTKMDLKSRFQSGHAFNLEPQGACKDGDDEKHAGGAVIGDAEIPFCLSLHELRKVPPTALVEQVGSLMAHELAHQAGFDEDRAALFQAQVLKLFKNEAGRERFIIMLKALKSAIHRSLALISKHAKPTLICAQVGEAAAFLETAKSSDLGLMLENRNTRFDRIHGVQVFLNKTSLENYCKNPDRAQALPETIRALKANQALILSDENWL